MKKHRTPTRPTGLSRLRSLVTFRHQNPAARLVSALAATSLGVLLVAGHGVAYAAGTTVDVPCDYQSPDFAVVSDFEIDGNLCLDGDPTNGLQDWDSLAYTGPTTGDTVVDGLDDDSGFTQGSSETSLPTTWVGGLTPNNKNDIESAWGYSKAVSGHVYAYFGFTSSSQSGGTQEVNMEYNQLPPVQNDASNLAVPDRLPGDLLFHFSMNGSAPLSFSQVLVWTLASDSTWIPPSNDPTSCTPVSGYSTPAGWCPVQGVDAATTFHSAVSADGQFGEGSIDISALPIFEGGCSGEFGTMQMRTTTGNSWTSAMKDYVGPLTVDTPSTCGKLVITKTDADASTPGNPAYVPGAVFAITGDPRPGGSATDTYCVFDGVEADMPAEPADCDFYVADGVGDGIVTINPAEPRESYTVTEIVPPPGYLLNGDASDSWSGGVSEQETVPVSFANHKQWAPLAISKQAAGWYDATYLWDVDKQIASSANGPWTDATTPGAPLTKTVDPGGDTRLYYKVVVTEKGVNRTSYRVTGTITVNNPNDAPVTATIDESLPNCTIDGSAAPITRSVPADGEGGGTVYGYSCALGDNLTEPPTQNTASVVWDRSDYPQSTEDINAVGNYDPVVSEPASISFAQASWTDHTVVVTDDHHVFDPAWVISYGDEEDGTYESAVYSTDTQAAAGTCSAVVTNVATLDALAIEVPSRLASVPALADDSESGRVCVNAPPSPPVVVVSPPEQQHPAVLPNTGGPDGWLLGGGLALLLAGATLVLGDRRRRRRS